MKSMYKNNYLKNLLNIVLSAIILIAFCFIVSIAVIYSHRVSNTKKNDYSFLNGLSNKVVLVIGDGMGKEHVKLNRSLEKYILESKINGDVETNSLSIFGPTDSAASATAMATGVKVLNRRLSKNDRRDIKNISEYTKEIGKGVGIVTTDMLTGATPAAFSSHSLDRSYDEEIIRGQAKSNIDIFLGKGKDLYLSHKNDFEENGYSIFTEKGEIDLNSNKIVGAFSQVDNTYRSDENYDILELTKIAIEFLEKKYGDKGYFLMIEEAHIDKNSHSNNIEGAADAVNGLYNVISYLDEYMKTCNDFSFVLTSDHETGDLIIDGTEYTNEMYHSKGHTKKNVYYLVKTNANIDNTKMPSTIDNTDIFKICKGLLTNE